VGERDYDIKMEMTDKALESACWFRVRVGSGL